MPNQSHPPSAWDPVYLMGVSGCGKTVVGVDLARRLGGTFIDGDDLHPPANKRKMGAGIPLNDDDRAPWFAAIRQAVAGAGKRPVVVACSALKRAYRDTLRAGQARAVFVFLKGDYDLIMGRIRKRDHEYMPPGLLRSQFDTLEEPAPDEKVVEVDIGQSVAEIVGGLLPRLTEGNFIG